MRRIGTVLVAAMVAALTALGSLGEAQDRWQPMPLHLDTAFAEAQPPRALLEQQATVSLTGNVAHVVRALAEGAGRDWVVSAPSEDFGPAKEFRVEGLPLWQAMDRLLETYGYDWGVHAKVLVAWPATQPARERPETPAPEEEVWADATPRESLVVDRPTPVTELLAALSRPWDGEQKAEYVCLAPELRPWHVIGYIGKLDRLKGGSVPAAVGAIVEYAGGVMGLKYGTLRRLDEALAIRQTAVPETEDTSAEASIARRTRFRNAVLSLLSAQQFVYLRSSGEVQVAFRELPSEAAVLFLEIMDEMARTKGEPWPVDWTQPQRLYVTVRAGHASFEQRDGTMLTLPILQVGCNIPLLGDVMARF